MDLITWKTYDLPGVSPGIKPCWKATCFGHADVVQYLLEQKHDPDVQVTCHDDLKQRTIIETAAVLGHEEVMKALLATNVQTLFCKISKMGKLRNSLGLC